MLAPTSPPAPVMAVSASERAFYVEMGQRIATLRKAQGLTQVQLAEALGVAQQTLAHHEAGRLRLLAGALPTLADQLGVSVEELVGTRTRRSAGKRGPRGQDRTATGTGQPTTEGVAARGQVRYWIRYSHKSAASN